MYKRTTLFWATHISLISHQPSATPSVQKFFTMSSKCIFCKQQVRPRQEGLQCDGCLRWQHRTCETGVSQSSYRSAVKTGSSIDWFCSTRDVPQAESTRILFSESDWVRTLKRSDYFVERSDYLWNEVTIVWNEVTVKWNEVTWNEVTMERSDRNSLRT